jgi:glyoxylase I family protein
MKLGMMMIFVSDLHEAKRFYRDVLEFPLKGESDSHLVFAHQGCDLVAFKCEKNTKVEDYSRVARSVFVFEVLSLDRAFLDLRSKGVRFLHNEPAENSLGRYVAFRDPFGNVHELFEPKS